MGIKTLKKAVKRVNKNKQEIISDFKHQEKVAHIKEIVKAIYPILEDVDCIYDAQTVVNALSGFIEVHTSHELNKIKLSTVDIDLSKEEDSKIKTAMLKIVDLMKDESANELSETLERLGRTLSEYSAHTYMKQGMDKININDILA